jgi:excinuclease ABC subunit C
MTIGGKDTLKSYLKQKYGRAISIVIPQKGMKKRLVDLASKNAYQKIKEHLFKYNPQNAMLELKKLLKLEHALHLIEAFDVATLLGSFSVASMVRFTNALPDKKNYRRFKIKYVSEQNDVEMIKEAVARRYQRLLNEQKSLPNLILIDGGKPQVNAAFEILKELEIHEVPLIGLAKQHEEIYTHGEKKQILLEKGNEALRLLMAIRDEAHRFATTYHVKIRDKATTHSRLKEIPGIGEALVQKILASSVKLNGHTTIDRLKEIPGIGVKKAREILEALHTKNNNS